MKLTLIAFISCALIASVFSWDDSENKEHCPIQKFPEVCSELNYLTCAEQKFVSSLEGLNPGTCGIGCTCSAPNVVCTVSNSIGGSITGCVGCTNSGNTCTDVTGEYCVCTQTYPTCTPIGGSSCTCGTPGGSPLACTAGGTPSHTVADATCVLAGYHASDTYLLASDFNVFVGDLTSLLANVFNELSLANYASCGTPTKCYQDGVKHEIDGYYV
jgi:hypothetical protein